MPPSAAASAPSIAPISAPSSPAAPKPISAPTTAPNSAASSSLRSLRSIITRSPCSSLRTKAMSTSRITSRSRRSSSTAMISPLNSPPAKPTTSSCTGPIVIDVSSSSLRSAGQQLLLGLVELVLGEHALVHQALELDELGGDVRAPGGGRRRRSRGDRRGRGRGCLRRLLLVLLRLQL